ncbi:hypothetical protein C7459_102217 [Tumebacillus permanentifrigoris]|uniref:Uncharacterized protein n=1 Tax=Tumebacillus permanentifrigoris TaxID=378543 RepID=A0A316DCN2_9BACL|nr:hypothetical protein C7459_102217 [Tumebacillus permanentifrigoris]
MLRSFIYLDKVTLDDYLASLDGYIVGDEIEQNEIERSISDKYFQNDNVTNDSSRETRQKLVVPLASKFQRLYTLMEQKSLIHQLDDMNNDDYIGIKRGSIIEAQVSINLPDIIKVIEGLGNMTPYFDLLGDESPIQTDKDKELFGKIVGLGEINKNNDFSVIMKSVLEKNRKLITNLKRSNLLQELRDLQGECTILGKVQSILPKGKTHEVNFLASEIKELLEIGNRQQRRQKPKNNVPNEIMEVVKGPALLLIPLAIYR